jgi:malonyl-CoA decarboxylase
VEETELPRLIDRTIGNLRRAWQDLTGAARVRLTGTVRPDLPKDDQERLKPQIDECLVGRGGEVSARARAADLGRTYLGLVAKGRERFLQLLAYEYGVDEEKLAQTVANWSELHRKNSKARVDPLTLQQAEAALRDALTPPRVRLLSQFNALPQGVKFLVDMRAELVLMTAEDPVLKALDDDLKRLLVSWFDVGFLDLRCITWDAPASLLEKLARYEAVHAIKSWGDIKNRLAPDRRCYAFFHPKMPDEPLIYVWVALVKGMSDDVQKLLEVRREPLEDPKDADSAIFYSISNAQDGLVGISFGDFLIKRVVEALAEDFKQLKTFATLSPIPGFSRWLGQQLAERGEELWLPAEQRLLAELAGGKTPSELMADLSEHKGWYRVSEFEGAVRPGLMRLCADYLFHAKRGKYAANRVAHFHLSNGARMERINWLGDTSAKGLRESYGMMINYRYRSSDIEKNHEAYKGDGKIKTSGAFRALLKS